MTQKNELVVTHQQALAELEKQESPGAKAILDYVNAIKSKNVAVLGEDEAFVLQNDGGQIKAFKKALTLSEQEGTLIQPVYNGDYVISAQGYEVWAEATGTSVVFPREVLVGSEWKPNPYAERDETNRRILAVHCCAIAFRYSSMGIPQVSSWTTIFDTPSYRMIDLLAKAKKLPQAFKLLPVGMAPPVTHHKQTDEQKEGGEEKVPVQTWASYPFDESLSLWINTSHDEVITWLSQILNREKKAMDFAQSFAKRNATKHLSGKQKAPGNVWKLAVLAWRPSGNNAIKWDAAQYANLQDRVAEMVKGGGSDEFTQKIELKQGSERVSEEEGFETLEAEVDPEDAPESASVEEVQKPDEKKPEPEPEVIPEETKQEEPSKEVQQAIYLSKEFEDEYKEACEMFGVDLPPQKLSVQSAVKICKKVSELVDMKDQ